MSPLPHLSPPSLHAFTWLPLLSCPLAWLSSPCRSVPFLSSALSPLLIPSRWLYFSRLQPFSPQSIVSLLPVLTWRSVSPPLFIFQPSSPPITLPFPFWTRLGLLVAGWSVLLWFPPPPPAAVGSSSALPVVYLRREREGELPGWIDG